MPTRLLLAIAGVLLLVRLPSLAQPMGPDQGLYAYVGDRILQHELAYRDAWDQKPPGIHYVYAGLRWLSRSDVAIAAADLIAAAIVAALLFFIGRRLHGPAAGGLAAVVFLLLSDPGMDRYGGVRVRAQAETFIALAVAAAVAFGVGLGAEARSAKAAAKASGMKVAVAGLLIGAAFALKYNAGAYALVVLLAIWSTTGLRVRDAVIVAAGAAVVPAVLFAVFWRGGALDDLYQATIAYNLRYSGETYASRLDMLRYLVTFPLNHARLSPLWLVGGLGCLILLARSIRSRLLLLPVVWVAVACLSIAINGSRELPQYFVQATPALALAAGVAAASALTTAPAVVRWIVAILIAFGCWRAGAEPFPTKLAANVWHDTQYIAGRIDRRTHLARYGGARDVDKYSALDNIDIGAFLAQRTSPDETVYVFGFSPGSYAYAGRRSASRFFWSRPVILDFNRDNPSYGVQGLRMDLERQPPAYVILQQHDWSPDVRDSAPFFLSEPRLAGWLHANYHEVHPFLDGFSAWERNGR